ncbi:MAG: hypothetical protein EBY29_14945, partial [Planctomycetes bacterium]|nr:hypothetical protein [Planctomycetota bacterium]
MGLALAKSAISVEKRVAFAFGCETASDIRLHYFAAAEYQINKRSGGIGKVDNSVGDKVEIMICDVASYLVAMHYMLAFNDESRIVTYWDEPTITMDYESHELHATIHRNWAENKISKMVLSCATLPKEDEIAATLYDFRQRFAVKMDDGDDDVPLYGYQADADETVERTPAEIHTIDSFDCKKSIAIIDKDTHTVMPHVLFEAYRDVLHSVDHCEENKTLLRYLDVREIVRLVEWLVARSWLDAIYHPSRRFKHVKDVHLTSIKEYYLDVLRNLDQDKWGEIHRYMKQTQTPRFSTNAPLLRKTQSADSSVSSLAGQPLARTNSVAAPCAPVATNPGILLTTKDAHTLTDGPAIFLAEDVDKIGKFYIQQTNLPESIFLSILEKIERNNAIQKHIGMLERQLDDRMQANTAKEGGDKK